MIYNTYMGFLSGLILGAASILFAKALKKKMPKSKLDHYEKEAKLFWRDLKGSADKLKKDSLDKEMENMANSYQRLAKKFEKNSKKRLAIAEDWLEYSKNLWHEYNLEGKVDDNLKKINKLKRKHIEKRFNKLLGPKKNETE